jgi:hypothetical protein
MNDDSTTTDDLGPRLYGESAHNTPAVFYTSLGAAFVLVGVLLCFVPADPREPDNPALVGGRLVAGLGALCLVTGLVRLVPNLGASWHLHERGVRLVRRSGERVLLDKDVEELTVKVVRVFFHGVCTGEVHEATFQSHGPANKVFIKQVRRPSTTSGADLDRPGELAQACDKVAELIANRMAARLLRGEPIPWVKAMRIHPDGLDVESPAAMQGRIPWGQIEIVGIDEGMFQLWRRGDSQPALQVPTHLPNFFPGYRLILDRVKANAESAETTRRVQGG